LLFYPIDDDGKCGRGVGGSGSGYEINGGFGDRACRVRCLYTQVMLSVAGADRGIERGGLVCPNLRTIKQEFE